MKVRKIQFKNHSVFGNLDFDFTDHNGRTVNTIIIAGENGVGKSLLLHSIFEFSSLNVFGQIKSDELRIFELELSSKEVGILMASPIKDQLTAYAIIDNIFRISINYNIVDDWSRIDISTKAESGNFEKVNSEAFSHSYTRQILKVIFSDVEINFTPTQVTTVTSKDIDQSVAESERSGSNLATEITQLLVDVQNLDALDFSEWARQSPGKVVDESKLDIRMKRFTNAFDSMFPNKKYKKIANLNGQKHIIFEEFGREVPIYKLSSGEKQIVFRGSFLLKDQKSSEGALILIDEPEISLHPSWQLKVSSFFKRLFTSDKGDQTSQLFFATHSPFILHNANRINDKVIILQKNNGQVTVQNNAKFYTWSSEEMIQKAFSVANIFTSYKTIVFLEGETDESYYRTCQQVFHNLDSTIQYCWIGRINDKGNAENTGDTALNQAKTFFLANPEHMKGKVILFYDCDTKKPEEDIGQLIIRRMTFNHDNSKFKKGVENLLTLIPEIEIESYYAQKIQIDDYGAESILKRLDKTKLCSFICETLPEEDKKNVLVKLHVEMERLQNESLNTNNTI